MIVKLAKSMLVAGALALSVPAFVAPAQAFETLKSEEVAENVTLIRFDGTRIHTFHGVSNSHIIETANELRVVDAQFLLPHAKGLKKYIESLGKPLVQIILSHNHPDHWFGARVIADLAPVATSKNIATDLKNGGGRYIKNIGKNPKMKDSVPEKVIVPNQEVKLGKQTWDGLDVILSIQSRKRIIHC